MRETAKLADFVVRTDFASLPRDVVDQTKKCILDWLGVTLAGSKEKPAKIVTTLIERLDKSKESTIVGYGNKVSCLNAALVNGVASHVIELDDLHVGAILHPSVTTVSAALAIAEKEAKGGKDLITATVVGYDVQTRVSMAVVPSHYSERHFHSTGTCGTFGAAAATGKLLDLGREEMENAFGIAGCQAAGLNEAFGTMCKPLHAGKAAQNGIMAALLARNGFSGPTSVLEGERGFWRAMANSCDFSKAIDRLGEKFEIMNVMFKMHASCGASHGAIDAFLEIIKKYGIEPEDITEIYVGGSPVVLDNVGRIHTPQTVFEAKFSLPYCLALAATDKEVSLNGFTHDRIKDKKLLELAKRVKVSIDTELSQKGYGGIGAKVIVKTKDGKKFSCSVDAPKGTPTNPVTVEALTAKFRLLARAALTSEKIEKIVTVLGELQRSKSVCELTELL